MGVKPFLTDPVFPQLEVAGDLETMRGVFEEHLRPIGRDTYRITDCRLFRIRYRRGARCILQYALRLADSDTGYERTQWVTGVMYSKDRTRREWEKLQTSYPRGTPDGGLSAFAPFAFVPHLEMLVEVFPYDRRLPTLPLVMARPLPELEHPVLVRFGPGNWHVEAWNVEPVRYRAGLGATLRLTVQAQDDATGRRIGRRFYAKVYRNGDQGQQTHRVLRTLWKGSCPGEEVFTVARPIAYLGSLRTLLQEEAPGTSLQEILLQGNGTIPAVRKAAKALALLHLGDVPSPQHRSFEDEVASLERAGRLLRWACPHLGAEVGAIIRAVVAGLEGSPSAPTHLDLKLDHILLDGDRLTLLDFDTFAEADPILDAADILAHLACMPLRFPLLHDDRWGMAAETFAEEYFAHVPRTWRSRLPLQYAGAVLKAAVGFFRRQEPCWPEKIATLVKEARDSSTGRVW